MKRCDLQGIRGLAIVFVLAFHMGPFNFPLGFIGVDMFFVLSGYLMAMILGRDRLTLDTLKSFYVKRFIRIVPEFYVIVAGVYSVCAMFLMRLDRPQFVTDMTFGVTFTSNFQPLFEIRSYWDQLYENRFWVHTWSLGAEIQFYAIAPVLLGWTRSWRYLNKMALYFTIVVVSFFLQIFLTEKLSYGMVFCRIWQFVLGAVVYEMESKAPTGYCSLRPIDPFPEMDMEMKPPGAEDRVIIKPKATTNSRCSYTRNDVIRDFFIVMFILMVALQNFWIPKDIARVIATLGTAIVIYVSNPASKYSILNNRIVVYFGDTSYACYLFHWPIIVLFKYRLNVVELSEYLVFYILLIIITCTVLFYHYVEKFLVRQSFTFSAFVCSFALLYIFLTVPAFNRYQPTIKSYGNRTSQEMEDILEENLREAQKIYYNIGCENDTETMQYTNFTEEPQLRCQKYGNGSLNILVMGNSIAYRAFPLIDSILKGRYNELRLFSRSFCSPIAEESSCTFTPATMKVVDHMRPDIILLVYIKNDQDFKGPVVDMKTDKIHNTMQKLVNYYSKRTKHMIIDLPYYIPNHGGSYDIYKRLTRGDPLDDLKIPRNQTLDAQKHHLARLTAVKCRNCVFNKINEAIYENGGDTFYLYNRSSLLAYTKDGIHYTDEGLKLLRPSYERVIEPIMTKLLKAN